MGPLTLLAIAVALAMDAFAVAVVTGLTSDDLRPSQVLRMSSSFGLFQALMPVLGWAAGTAVRDEIASTDHWIAFLLLTFAGGKMVWAGLKRNDAARVASDPTAGLNLLLLSVATSVDALAVGLSLAMLKTAIVLPAAVIGITAAALTAVGMLLGRRIGAAWGRRVEVLGGVVLIAIGIRIVVQHTM